MMGKLYPSPYFCSYCLEHITLIVLCRGHLEAVKYLVEQQAVLSQIDNLGRMPLDLAEDYKHQNVVDFLKARNKPEATASSDAPMMTKLVLCFTTRDGKQPRLAGRSHKFMWNTKTRVEITLCLLWGLFENCWQSEKKTFERSLVVSFMKTFGVSPPHPSCCPPLGCPGCLTSAHSPPHVGPSHLGPPTGSK